MFHVLHEIYVLRFASSTYVLCSAWNFICLQRIKNIEYTPRLCRQKYHIMIRVSQFGQFHKPVFKKTRIYITEASMHTVYSCRSRRCSKNYLFPPMARLLYFLGSDVKSACSNPFLVNDQAQGQVDSLIPLLFRQYNDAQFAIDIPSPCLRPRFLASNKQPMRYLSRTYMIIRS